MTDTRVQPIEPHDIAAVHSTYRIEEVNQYLAAGWIITAIARQQSGPDDVSVAYHLGWSRHLGEPGIPEEVRRSREYLKDWLASKVD